MKENIVTTFFIVFVLTVLFLGIMWKKFEYNECKLVGHSTFYCVLNIGRK